MDEFDDRATTNDDPLRRGSLSAESLTTLAQSVGAAADSQLPVEVTLAMLAEESDDRRLARVAQRLAAQLEQGTPLPQAFERLDGQLPPEIGALMRAGIEAGDLARAINQFSQQRLEAQRVRRRIQSVIAYPLIVVAILVPLTLFLSIFVIPMFKDIFVEFDLTLPVITELILQAAEQLPQFLLGALVFVLGVPLVLRVVGGRWLLHRFRAALPMLGPIWTLAGQREFAAGLGSFIKFRMPLVAAVAHTGGTIIDRNVGRACQRVSKRLETGATLSDCLRQSLHFDRSLVALVAWGEKQGLLPEALALATHVFDDRIDQYATLLRRLLPPITLMVVVVMMFYVIVSLMVPLVRLVESLSM